jgi:hypothetical protein
MFLAGMIINPAMQEGKNILEVLGYIEKEDFVDEEVLE